MDNYIISLYRAKFTWVLLEFILKIGRNIKIQEYTESVIAIDKRKVALEIEIQS